MKKRPERPSEAMERFIHGATADAEAGTSKNSRPAATGFVRRTFDLQESLARELKIEAAKQDRPMRELVEEALIAYLS